MEVINEVTIPAVHGKPITIDYVLGETHSWLKMRVMDIIPEDDKPALQCRIDLIQSMIDARKQRTIDTAHGDSECAG